jgi:hypothetical protein
VLAGRPEHGRPRCGARLAGVGSANRGRPGLGRKCSQPRCRRRTAGSRPVQEALRRSRRACPRASHHDALLPRRPGGFFAPSHWPAADPEQTRPSAPAVRPATTPPPGE